MPEKLSGDPRGAGKQDLQYYSTWKLRRYYDFILGLILQPTSQINSIR